MPSYRPTLSAALPDGWLAKESITLLAPDGQANVIISSEPIDAIDSRQYAETQGWLLAHEFPHFQQHQFDEVVVFGRFLGYVRQFSWTPPDPRPDDRWHE